MFRFLAATGLRFSELAGLQWRHLHLDGGSPHVKVRRAIVRGRVEPPKTRHGRRDVPIPHSLVLALEPPAADRSGHATTDLVFAGMTGEPINYANLRHGCSSRRARRPASRG